MGERSVTLLGATLVLRVRHSGALVVRVLDAMARLGLVEKVQPTRKGDA